MCRNTQKHRLYSLMVFIILLTVVSVGQSALFFLLSGKLQRLSTSLHFLGKCSFISHLMQRQTYTGHKWQHLNIDFLERSCSGRHVETVNCRDLFVEEEITL